MAWEIRIRRATASPPSPVGTNENSPEANGSEGVMYLVAGVGFEPTTFRL